jgi:HEAT repeat protein
MSQTFDSIIQELHDPNTNTRSQAVFALDKLGDNEAILDELLKALATESDLNVREDITWALVRRKDKAIQPLIRDLTHENWHVRHNAVHVLGKIANPLATDALMKLLGDENPIVVSKTALALSQIADSKAIPALVAILSHEKPEIQSMLRDVLEGFGEKAISALAQAIQSDNWQVREQAAEVLGQIEHEESIALLSQALSDEAWQVRFAAIMGLSYQGEKAAIHALQNDPNEQVRRLVTGLIKR